MTYKTSLFLACAALGLTSALACVTVEDPFESLTTDTLTTDTLSTSDTTGDGDPTTGDGDPTTGDGDGDPTTGDGDGDPTTGDGDGDPGTGGDDPYNPEGCMEPSALLSLEGIEGTMCAPPCVGDADCPAGPAGTTAACALVDPDGGDMEPDFCALICDLMNDTCPTGSTCKDSGQGPGICTYP